MVALSALRAYDEPPLQVRSQRSAHDAEVLLEDKVVRGGHADHLVIILPVVGASMAVKVLGIGLGTLVGGGGRVGGHDVCEGGDICLVDLG